MCLFSQFSTFFSQLTHLGRGAAASPMPTSQAHPYIWLRALWGNWLFCSSCHAWKASQLVDVWRSQPWVLKILIRKDMETLSSKFPYFITDHKITESLRLAKYPRSSSPTFNRIPQCQLNHISKWHVYLFFWTLPWIVSSSFLWEACSNLLLFATKISISK